MIASSSVFRDVARETARDLRAPSALRALDSRLYGEMPGSEIDTHLHVGRVKRDRRTARSTVNAELWRPAADELEAAHPLVVHEEGPGDGVLVRRRRWRALFASTPNDRGGGSVPVRDFEILRLRDAVI